MNISLSHGENFTLIGIQIKKKIKNMGHIIKITESQLKKIVENVIKEYEDGERFQKLARKYNKKNLTGDQAADAMVGLNDMLNGYGVEAVRGKSEKGGFWGNILFIYVNMGEAYENTIIYDTEKEEFVAATWGDYYEENYSENEGDEEDLEDEEYPESEREEDIDWEREYQSDYDYEAGAPTPYD